jgi:hypothetical protein
MECYDITVWFTISPLIMGHWYCRNTRRLLILAGFMYNCSVSGTGRRSMAGTGQNLRGG